MSKHSQDFERISKSVIGCYQDEMHKWLDSNSDGKLTDADVIIMVMNLTIGLSTNIYYSLKNILPRAPLDFDYMKATMMNSMIAAFEKIKDYKPSEAMRTLTIDEVKEAQEKGFVIIKNEDGSERKVLKEEIYFSKDTAEKMKEEVKKQAILSSKEPKLILPHGVKR